MKSHMWGSTFVADGKVYCGDEDGDVRVFADDKQLKVISEVNMEFAGLSTPIVANGTLFIGTQTHLFAIAEGRQARPPKQSRKRRRPQEITRAAEAPPPVIRHPGLRARRNFSLHF
jgi:hypothetical protein